MPMPSAALDHCRELLDLGRGHGHHFNIRQVLIQDIHHTGPQDLIYAAGRACSKQDLRALAAS